MFTKTDIENYFTGEKTAASILFLIGVVLILFAIIALIFFKTQYWRGVAIAAGIIAIIQLSMSGVVYNRADKQRTDMVYNYDMNPQRIITEEIPRMEKVNSRFIYYLLLEIIGLLIGIFLIYYFREKLDKQFWVGVGLALILQSAIFLITDSMASSRAKIYTGKMISFYQPKK
ncbi:MAG: hypothetical protein JSS67_06950 [Bacteroidetes bacterium]|nr:hypothetical protein [Bacteroidota bacterium]